MPMPNCTPDVASQEYGESIIRYYGRPGPVIDYFPNNCVHFVSDEYAIVYFPLAELLPLSILTNTYNGIPKLYAPLDTTSMDSSGITSTFANPLLNSRGQGVLVGFIDTGIDYTNSLFKNRDGTTRILRIWDQTIPPDPLKNTMSPQIFSYGTEFTSEQINTALASEDPRSIVPTTDPTGHGTFVAGIAAGNEDLSAQFTGAAPDCRIAMVKLKPAKDYLRDFFGIPAAAEAYQENDLMAATTYLAWLSRSLRLPLVICIAMGTNSGSHDGTSPFGRQLNEFSGQLGWIITAAAGNETGQGHHYFGTSSPTEDYNDVEIRVAPGEAGFTIELWADLPQQYAVGFTTPTGESVPMVALDETLDRQLTFRLNPTEIYVTYRAVEIGSGSQLVFIRFRTPTPGLWRIRVFNLFNFQGQYNMWLPITGHVSEDTRFLQPNPDTTITDPGNVVGLITSSTYNHNNGSIYIHSSRGNTRTGNLKPDLAAPGVDVYGPVPSGFGRRTGSSIAVAHLAGAAANLLSWGMVQGNHPNINSQVAKSLLVRGADRNPIYSYPNVEFGYGTLNLYKTFTI